jgi:hypothetical protein
MSVNPDDINAVAESLGGNDPVDLGTVADVEQMLHNLEETMRGCTNVLANLQDIRADVPQCEKIARIFDSKLRVFLTRLQSKRDSFAVLRESDVSEYFQEMATQQKLLAKQLQKIQTDADLNELQQSFSTLAHILESICELTT